MKAPRLFSRVSASFVMLAGTIAPIGCGGHPEEGILKLPPRQAETAEVSKADSQKASPGGKKSRQVNKDVTTGK